MSSSYCVTPACSSLLGFHAQQYMPGHTSTSSKVFIIHAASQLRWLVGIRPSVSLCYSHQSTGGPGDAAARYPAAVPASWIAQAGGIRPLCLPLACISPAVRYILLHPLATVVSGPATPCRHHLPLCHHHPCHKSASLAGRGSPLCQPWLAVIRALVDQATRPRGIRPLCLPRGLCSRR